MIMLQIKLHAVRVADSKILIIIYSNVRVFFDPFCSLATNHKYHFDIGDHLKWILFIHLFFKKENQGDF